MANEKQSSIDMMAQAFAKALQDNNQGSITNASSVALEINKKINDRADAQRRFANRITNEMNANKHCVAVTVPKIYYDYQPSFVITLNGCTIKVPADGKTRIVHEEFATILLRRMRALDDKIEAMRSNQNDIRELPR